LLSSGRFYYGAAQSRSQLGRLLAVFRAVFWVAFWVFCWVVLGTGSPFPSRLRDIAQKKLTLPGLVRSPQFSCWFSPQPSRQRHQKWQARSEISVVFRATFTEPLRDHEFDRTVLADEATVFAAEGVDPPEMDLKSPSRGSFGLPGPVEMGTRRETPKERVVTIDTVHDLVAEQDPSKPADRMVGLHIGEAGRVASVEIRRGPRL